MPNVVGLASSRVRIVEDNRSLRTPEYRYPGELVLSSIQEDTCSTWCRFTKAGQGNNRDAEVVSQLANIQR
jgi:hypothetical protein